jgi:nitrite reductase (NADH) large subunit
MFAGEEAVTAVVLESGETLSVDMVIVTAGIRCNSSLGRQADLKVNKGIVVDSRMGTCDADIYAAGDVAEHQGIVYGAWMPALQQGRVAGINAAGGAADFPGVAPSYIIKVLDIDLFSIGEIHPADGSYQVFEDHDEDRYACFVFQNFHLVGAILMGDTSLSPRVRALVENRVSCHEILIEAGSGRDIRERLRTAVGGK